jgi:hypothetical protein
MADNETEIVSLRDDFHRDSFGKLMLIMAGMIGAIVLLLATSLYLYLSEPPPITFPVNKEWRVQPDVPLEQPYLETPILLQWVSDTLRNAFQFDFIHYNDQLKSAAHNFTDDGWRVFLDQLNNYANYNDVQTKKMFINSIPDSAPFLINPGGVLLGRWAWWIQAPITIHYIGNDGTSSKTLTLQVLVVRVPTLNNLMGVGIDNIIVAQGAGAKAAGGT